MFITQATQLAGRTIEFRADLVAVIDKLQGVLGAGGAQASYTDALLELVRFARGESTREEAIGEVLGALELDAAPVIARLQRLEGYLGQFVDLAEPVFAQLDQAGDLFEIPLGVSADARRFETGEILMSLGAGAEAALAVRSVGAGATPEGWTGAVDAASALQEIHVSGSLGATGQASGSVSSVNLDGQASASAEAHVNLYHQYLGTTTRIGALVQASGNWSAPWDFEGLARQLQPVGEDGACRGFRRVQIHARGAFSMAGSVTAGRTLSFSREVTTPAGLADLSATAVLGARLGVSLKRHGSFTTVIEKDADGFLRYDLVRGAKRHTAADLNLGADIEVTGLDKVAAPYVKQFFRDPADLLGKLEEWTRPGDLLVAKLKAKAPKDQPVARELLTLLVGEGEAGNAAKRLVEVLDDRIAALLNERLPFWGEDPGDLAERMLSRLAGTLELDSELARRLLSELKPEVEGRIGEVLSDFEAKIQKTLGKGTKHLEQLLEPFESVGEDVAALKKKVDAKAEAIVSPAIRLLKRYQDIRNRLLTGLRKAANYKIGMAYTARIERERASSTLLSYKVREVNARTRTLHRALVLGRLGSFWRDFDAAREAGEIFAIEGRFGELASSTRTVGFAVNFGKFALDSRRVQAEDIAVDVDPNGTVLAASVRLTQEKIVKTFYKEHSIDLVGAYDLALAAKDPQAFPAPLGFNVSFQHEDLESEDLRDFLASLEREVCGRRLLSPGAAQRAINHWDQLCEHHQGGDLGARIDMALPVGIGQLARLVDFDNALIRRKAAEVLLELEPTQEQTALARRLAAQQDPSWPAPRIIAFFADFRDEAQFRKRFEDDPVVGSIVLSRRISDTRRFLRLFRQMERDLDDLLGAVDGIRAVARLREQLAALPDEPPPDTARRLARELETLARDINRNVRAWVQTPGLITAMFCIAVPQKTVALLHLVSALGQVESRIVPLVSALNAGGDQFVVA